MIQTPQRELSESEAIFTYAAFFLSSDLAWCQSLTINTPLKVVQCQPVLITWVGGIPPYDLSLLGSTNTSFADEVLGTSYSWTVNIDRGESIRIGLTDATGATAFTTPITVNAGSDDCINSSVTSGITSTPSPTSALPNNDDSDGDSSPNVGAIVGGVLGGVVVLVAVLLYLVWRRVRRRRAVDHRNQTNLLSGPPSPSATPLNSFTVTPFTDAELHSPADLSTTNVTRTNDVGETSMAWGGAARDEKVELAKKRQRELEGQMRQVDAEISTMSSSATPGTSSAMGDRSTAAGSEAQSMADMAEQMRLMREQIVELQAMRENVEEDAGPLVPPPDYHKLQPTPPY